MDVSVSKKEELVDAALRPAIQSTYKKLAASRYFTASHLEIISSDAKHRIRTHAEGFLLIGYYLYIKGVFSLTASDRTIDQSHRRFEHIYSSLGDEMKQLVLDEESSIMSSVLKRIITQLYQFESTSFSPWASLLHKLIPELSPHHIEEMDELLKKYTFKASSTEGVQLKSYVSLLAGREKDSLNQLMVVSSWSELPLTDHFRCLEQRERWRTILHWLEALFPHRNGRYGSLQSFADKSQSQLNQGGELLSDVWDRWLMAPSFQRFSALTAHEKPTKKAQIIEYVLPRLKDQLYQTQSVQVYIKLLIESKHFDKAAEYFLMYERNPLRLQEEKEQLLTEMKEWTPQLAMPVLHQFVVRLAEKKSRAHYEKAAYYVKELKKLYIHENLEDQFQEYMRLMKSEYKTYRAFIKELNVIHA